MPGAFLPCVFFFFFFFVLTAWLPAPQHWLSSSSPLPLPQRHQM